MEKAVRFGTGSLISLLLERHLVPCRVRGRNTRWSGGRRQK